jgi:uncharacterized protein YjiS (DUF1127 family)
MSTAPLPTAGRSYAADRGVDPARAGVIRAWRRLGLIASGAVTTMQIARMAATLNELTDPQLAALGIARHEIYRHAEKLILTGSDESDSTGA